MTESCVQRFDKATGRWVDAVPVPYPYRLLPWVWKRLTGWRDAYGRKAQLFLPWQ